MNESKVYTINSSGEKLVGIESTPDNSLEKNPTVLLVHGFGVDKDENGMFSELAEQLCKNGIQAYRFDFSGRGESEGNYCDTTLTKLKNDLQNILDFVRSQPMVDNDKLGILGQSLGTSTTITLAPKVTAMVMTGSVSHPKETLINLFGTEYNPDGLSIRKKPNGIEVNINPPFWKDFENHDLFASMKGITCPILFIHGSADDKVPLSDMEEYFAVANDPKEKIIIEGGDHGLRPHREKMYVIVTKWFTKWLN